MRNLLAQHWPEYVSEAICLGLFMMSACVFTVLLAHPMSTALQWVPDAGARMALMGLAMGGTLIAVVHTPWGQRSGAHMNPVVTLTYWTLGKVAPGDAVFYIAAQFAGGLGGVILARLVLGEMLEHAAVNYAATLPGPGGPGVAAVAEIGISFVMMSTVLRVSNSARWHRWTPFAAGVLVASFITFEAPLSGMSMNPARTLASALPAGEPLWPQIYFLGPLLGMGAAAGIYVFERGGRGVFCAKFHHHNSRRCIFNCRFGELSK